MKIAACDFDGTLFRDGVVSEADLEAIADWRRSGNAFGIVTGRGRNTLLRDVKRFSIPYDFLICNNGAMICDEQAQDVYCAVLPEPVRAEIMDHPGMRASSQCAFFAGTAIFTHAGKTDYWILKEHVLPRLSPVEALHMPGLHQISLAYGVVRSFYGRLRRECGRAFQQYLYRHHRPGREQGRGHDAPARAAALGRSQGSARHRRRYERPSHDPPFQRPRRGQCRAGGSGRRVLCLFERRPDVEGTGVGGIGGSLTDTFSLVY